jgi:DNA-binding transcriptional LysR family regulator
VTEATSASSGRLRLAATPSCSSYIVPPILKAFHERHPNVALELNSAHTADVLEMVLSRTVQLGFARALKHSRLEMLDLYVEELVPVVNPSHVLASAESVSMIQMAKHPNILFRNGSAYCGLVTSAYVRAEALPNIVMHLPSSDVIRKMVLAGVGISFLPRGYIENDLISGSLVEVRLKNAVNLNHRVVVQYLKENAGDELMNVFLDVVRSIYQRSQMSSPRPAAREQG